MKTISSAPAFSVPLPRVADGLTTREYFAARTLQALLSNSATEDGSSDIGTTVSDAVYIADLLIAELNKADNE